MKMQNPTNPRIRGASTGGESHGKATPPQVSAIAQAVVLATTIKFPLDEIEKAAINLGTNELTPNPVAQSFHKMSLAVSEDP
jgi:hypothetical protein